MTKSLDFFETEELFELVNRTSRASAAPVAIHVIDNNYILKKILGTEPFRACAFVQSCPKGREACNLDLQRAARLATRNQVLTPFICHMGFACVCHTLHFRDCLLLMTIGPYCPTEGRQSLVPDARKGLWNIGLDPSETDELVASIHITLPSSIEEIACWFVESLNERFFGQIEPEHQCDDKTNSTSHQQFERANTTKYSQSFLCKELLVLVEIGDVNGLENTVRPWLAQQTVRTSTNPNECFSRFTFLNLMGKLAEELHRNGLVWQRSQQELSKLLTQLGSAQEDSLTGLLIDFINAFIPAGSKETDWRTLIRRISKEIDADLPELQSIDGLRVKKQVEIMDFSRKLKQRLGVTFREFINVLKLRKARRLLSKTDLTNEEIALRIGFSSAMAFNRFFVRCTGTTPKEYRCLGEGIR